MESHGYSSVLLAKVGDDPSQWQVALAKTLAAFPAAAGRLRQAHALARLLVAICTGLWLSGAGEVGGQAVGTQAHGA